MTSDFQLEIAERSSLYLAISRRLLPAPLLIVFILIYTLYFSWYTINRHNTLNSYAADLSLIDQPMWNTVLGPGYFMEQTWGERQQPRLAEHFEPILIPLALLFFIWDDVRILLIAQSLALALGALPVFWIARDRLTLPKILPNPKSGWPALTFALVYLLSPHLQAANIADFHADPFVVTPLLFAFWYAIQERWRWMWLWAIMAMLTKENLPTLTAMLGLYLIIETGRTTIFRYYFSPSDLHHRYPQIYHGLALIVVSIVWFLVATFLVVAPLARQYFGTDGPIYLVNRFNGTGPNLLELFQNPARWHYLLGLLTSVGFLPLLAPELMLLGLPIIAANLLSNFPGQYSGEQHYSAPIVAALIIAAIYGTRRIVGKTSSSKTNGQSAKKPVLIYSCLWLLSWSLGYHILHGWTPLSIRTETYRMTSSVDLLPGLITQIPPEAIVSSSPAVHPHLAHRRVNYLFPIVKDSDYLLVDVTDISGVHPNDVRTQLFDLFKTGWQILEANNGLILAQKTSDSAPSLSPDLPDSFFNFARTSTHPTYTVPLTFGNDQLYLLGYDVTDDPDDGLIFRFYWQANAQLPEQLSVWPLIYDDQGRLLSDPTQTPMIASIWYPPTAWLPGETIMTETLPQPLPDSFHLGIAAGPSNSFQDPARRFSVGKISASNDTIVQPGHWAQLATFQRQGPLLIRFSPQATLLPLTPIQMRFGASIQLTGYHLDTNQPVRPGAELPLILSWITTEPLQTDLTVFVHLLTSDGRRVAQNDAMPTWLTSQPTSQWPMYSPIMDRHTLVLPSDLPPATYTLQLGLYNTTTSERLPLQDGQNILQLTQIQVIN